MKKTVKFLFVFLVVLSSLNLNAQEKTITGTVTSRSDGSAIPGVSVILMEDNSVGTETDFDGHYSINASVGQRLKFHLCSFLSIFTYFKLLSFSSVVYPFE